jgi:hypothetical protein
MKVRLKRPSAKYRDLTPGNVYRVIGIEANDYRIMNDVGRPYLYPPKLFEVIDAAPDRGWKTWYGDDGERYSYAEPLATPGFFESVFDGNKRAMATLFAYLSRPPGSRRVS